MPFLACYYDECFYGPELLHGAEVPAGIEKGSVVFKDPITTRLYYRDGLYNNEPLLIPIEYDTIYSVSRGEPRPLRYSEGKSFTNRRRNEQRRNVIRA